MSNSDPTTVAWQRAHCPAGQDLRPFAGPNGTLYEAAIIDLGGERLYVPMAWLRRSGVYPWPKRAPAGVRAVTGGKGGVRPLLGEDPGDGDSCLGMVHRARAGPPDDMRDPDFRLTLRFRYASTDAADGRPTDHGDVIYGYQTLLFTYMEDGNPDRRWDGAPAVLFPLRVGQAIDEPAIGLNRSRTPDGWYMSYPVTERISGHFELTDKVPQRLWPEYKARAERIYAWLKTPPAARDNSGKMTF